MKKSDSKSHRDNETLVKPISKKMATKLSPEINRYYREGGQTHRDRRFIYCRYISIQFCRLFRSQALKSNAI